MNIVVLDEVKQRNQQIVESIEEKRHKVTGCIGTSMFIERINEGSFDLIFLDVESWMHGKAIYSYFDFTKKLVDIPIFFYNAPDNFTSIPAREPNEKDKIFKVGVEIEEVLDELK